MDKIQKSAVIAVLFLSLAVIVMGVLPATAEDVVVNRDLPDEPVGPKPEVITVTLTQSGFSQIGDVGWVNEILPEGFTYVVGSVVDGDGYTVVIDEDYMETTDKITIPFGYSENTTTMTYKVEADTREHIRDAEFVGTWKTPISLNPLEYQTDEVTGDIKLTAAEEPTPTPTPPSNGGNGGNGGNSGGTSTPPAGTPAYIALGANPVDIPANGSSTSTITASVWDGEDWVLENLTVNFSTSQGKITASAVIENGTATAILTAGMEEGAATITAEGNLSGDIGIITITNTTAVNFTTPGATPTPTVNVTLTPTVTVSPTPTATVSPTPSPTKEPLIPGFEAVFAIASLFSVAYLVLRRRRGE